MNKHMRSKVFPLACSLMLLSGCTTTSTQPAESNTQKVQETAQETSEKETEINENIAAESELQKELLAEYKQEKYKEECEEVQYRDYMRFEDRYKGEKVYVIGTVDQAVDNVLRCYSDVGDEYYVVDKREYDTTKILTDDVVVIWGDYAGIKKITRAGNEEKAEVCAINAKYIDIYDGGVVSDYIFQPEVADSQTSGIEAASQYSTMYVVNCNTSITLRTDPATTADEICQIPLGAAVSYIESATNGFYKVAYLGKTGYALASYLGEGASNNEVQYLTMYVVNCEESITLRTSPSTSAGEICQIPLGAVVSYIEPAANGFYKISYLGNTGFALASYLE